MDASPRTARKFPGYTLAQLKASVEAGTANDAIIAEIAAREAGASVVYTVPQILGGKVSIRVGRM